MPDAPQQDWPLYDSMCREAEMAWLRSLTPADKFAIYNDLFNVVWEARKKLGVNERLDEWEWQQKLELRLRLVKSYAKWDEHQNKGTS